MRSAGLPDQRRMARRRIRSDARKVRARSVRRPGRVARRDRAPGRPCAPAPGEAAPSRPPRRGGGGSPADAPHQRSVGDPLQPGAPCRLRPRESLGRHAVRRALGRVANADPSGNAVVDAHLGLVARHGGRDPCRAAHRATAGGGARAAHPSASAAAACPTTFRDSPWAAVLVAALMVLILAGAIAAGRLAI
jgi:hypothetical protein